MLGPRCAISWTRTIIAGLAVHMKRFADPRGLPLAHGTGDGVVLSYAACVP